MISWLSNLRNSCRAHSASVRGSSEWERLYVSLLARSLTTATLINSKTYAFYDLRQPREEGLGAVL